MTQRADLVPPKEVEEQLARLADRPTHPVISLLTAVDRFQRLIDEIGNYRGSIADEYLNDLGARGHADTWLSIASEEEMSELLEWILPILDRLDQEYIAKSRPDEEGWIWAYSRLRPGSWWLRRLPEDEGLLEHFKLVGPGMREVTAESRGRRQSRLGG